MPQLRFTEEELMRSHDYAEPQIEAGERLHGGFDAEGRYVPPRTLVREPAVEAWTEALRARGTPPGLLIGHSLGGAAVLAAADAHLESLEDGTLAEFILEPSA